MEAMSQNSKTYYVILRRDLQSCQYVGKELVITDNLCDARKWAETFGGEVVEARLAQKILLSLQHASDTAH